MEIKAAYNQPTQTKPGAEANETLAQKNQAVQNQAILKTSMEVSLSSGNNSLALLYRSVVDEINTLLEDDLGPDSIQKAYDTKLDVSPEATAERIVSLSANFFSGYQSIHSEMDYETQVRSFVDVISGGIDQGFSEARDILDGMQVLEGDIATNIDTTYDLVQEKLALLVERLLAPEPTIDDAAPEPAESE